MANALAELEMRWLNPDRGVLDLAPLRYERAQEVLDGFGAAVALVEIFVDAEEIVLFTLRAGGKQPVIARVPLSSSRLASALKTYHKEIIEYTLHGDVGQSWQDCVRPLLTSVMPNLQEVTFLYLIPHGALRYLPFHCVEVDGGCLIDHFPIVYVPSLPLLNRVTTRSQIRERREPPQTLIVGNPTLDLDFAEVEARQVAKRFETEPLIGRQATKIAVRSGLADKDLVHLACHSYHSPFMPLQSGLLFAGRRVLTAEEIMTSGVQADLVVLSACESGLQTGEQGLPTVFLGAGASAVLATLWFVDDEVTAKFVVEFYSNLYNHTGHRTKATAKALQLAAQKIRKENSHPYHWAAFELTGVWD